MRISQQGLSLIRQFEGFRGAVYLDAAGLPTIGYGHLLKAGEAARFAAGIGEGEARVLLAADIVQAERAVARLVAVPLKQGQFDALVSFTFNLGVGALERSTLRRKLNRGEYGEVTVEMLRYVWAGGRKLAGLLRRRQAEAVLFLG